MTTGFLARGVVALPQRQLSSYRSDAVAVYEPSRTSR